MPALEDDYRVDLEHYSGPLDLLLYLVRRHEIDLNDIPIAVLTDQYLTHLKQIEQFDVNTAGEFLVMAATLLEIKSSMLLPQDMDDEAATDGDQETEDPRYELVRQLLAYKKYKDAATDLHDRRAFWAARFARPGIPDQAETDAPLDLDLEDVALGDLCHAFAQILATIGEDDGHEVIYDDTPISLHAEDILDRLHREGAMTLQAIFVGRATRTEMIGLFLAVLELVRQSRINVVQGSSGDPISLQLRAGGEAAGAVEGETESPATDVFTDPDGFEWPDEETRLRATQRAARRLERLKQRDFGTDAEAILDVDGSDLDKSDEGTDPRPQDV